MDKRTCVFNGCDRAYSAHGYCAGHLAQQERGQEMRPLRAYGGGKCSIQGCRKPLIARGWCRAHYRRWLVYGDPLKSAPPRPEKPATCGYPGCNRSYAYAGYCEGHARQRSAGRDLRPLAEVRKYVIDHHFFDVIDTEEKAYWLGFITADGCIIDTAEITINLSAVDAAHLGKLSASLSSDYPVRPASGGPASGPIVRWDVSSRPMVSALRALGVTPRKSATAVPWEGPAPLMRHYWRGMVDGDGGITLFRVRSSGPKNQWKVHLSGSRPCVEAFADWASAICGSRAKVTTAGRSMVCWYWNVGGNRMAPLVIRELYGDCSVSLDRKQALAERAIAR